MKHVTTQQKSRRLRKGNTVADRVVEALVLAEVKGFPGITDPRGTDCPGFGPGPTGCGATGPAVVVKASPGPAVVVKASPVERISAVICTYNEEENIAACIKSVAGVDEIVVSDDYSEDSTRKIAESLGAKVFLRSKEGGGSRLGGNLVTKKHVSDFLKRFGWEPSFHAGDYICNGADKAREAVGFAQGDWIIGPDADERVTWNLPELRKLLPSCDQIVHEFVHSHDANGNPHRVATISKLFRKSKTGFGGRTHTVMFPAGVILKTNLLRIDHYQKPHVQTHVMPTMEYSVLTDDDQRSRFYLGREYYYYHHYDRALTLFDLYLRDATGHIHEIAQARLYAARCYWEDGSGRGNEARKSALEALIINPMHKEVLEFLASPGVYHEPWSHKWAILAMAANNEDILF